MQNLGFPSRRINKATQKNPTGNTTLKCNPPIPGLGKERDVKEAVWKPEAYAWPFFLPSSFPLRPSKMRIHIYTSLAQPS